MLSILNFKHLEKQQIHKNCRKGTLYDHNVSHTTEFVFVSSSSPDRKRAKGVLLFLLLFLFLSLSFFRNSNFRLYGFAVSGRRQHEGTKIHYFCCACRTNHTRILNGNLSHTYTLTHLHFKS